MGKRTRFITIWLGICLLGLLVPAGSAGRGRADSLPESAYISGVTGHAQILTLSCEARSAVDWADFWGVKLSETGLLEALPRSDNPDKGFVGDPNDPWGYIPPNSYGVHARPVADLLNKRGFNVKARSGLTWDDLRAEIAAGRPVIVWIVGQMWAGAPVTYTDSNGKNVTVARFEHTMILIGYDASLVHVVDAYSGWTQTYYLNTFLNSWGVLGNMAITGGRASKRPPKGSGEGDTYTVIKGDTLKKVARRFNITWQNLAAINHIDYPYTIYPGQVLRLSRKPATPEPTSASTPVIWSGAYTAFLPYVQSALVTQETRPAKKSKDATSTPVASSEAEVYVVQPGDFLIGLGQRFGIDWRWLAKLNDIPYPYVIYPGQVLRLKE